MQVADLRIVLDALQTHARELAADRPEEETYTGLEVLVNRLRGLVQDIEKFFETALIDLTNLEGRSSRHTRIWVRQRGKIASIRKALQEARLNILTSLATLQS